MDGNTSLADSIKQDKAVLQSEYTEEGGDSEWLSVVFYVVPRKMKAANVPTQNVPGVSKGA